MMKTILLNWNVKNYSWESFEDQCKEIQETGYTIVKWDVKEAANKLSIGDRAFILKYGNDNPGIIGSGYSLSPTFKDKHWDEEKRSSGEQAEYAYFIVNTLFALPIISSKDLADHFSLKFPPNANAPQVSGREVKEGQKLELEWFKRTQSASPETVEQISRNLREGKEFYKISKYYERSRDAREACLKEFGYSCKICNFNFYEKYGEIGKNYIHVHHIVPLSEVGKSYIIDPKKDLIPICPNCHSMIHRSQKILSPEELKNSLKG